MPYRHLVKPLLVMLNFYLEYSLPFLMVQIDLSDKTALVMGVANARSLGWAIAEQLLSAGCRVGFSYQGERLKGELDKLLTGREGVWSQQADATSEEDLTALFPDQRLKLENPNDPSNMTARIPSKT